ncbi:hypothetical protein [Phenylobacterium sp.]|uniref:hypothetical protein n=1 Tax=Phenylobacterium sp. TaxID=1871053 RepID=UPI0035AFEA2C
MRRTDEPTEQPTKPAAIAEGRGRFKLTADSARAIAAATKKTGFPVPAHVQAVIDAERQSAPATTSPAETKEG